MESGYFNGVRARIKYLRVNKQGRVPQIDGAVVFVIRPLWKGALRQRRALRRQARTRFA